MKNADLWRERGVLMDARQSDTVRIVKVRGHASAQAVRMGHSTLEDKSGNDNADAFATAGAHMHLGSHTDREHFAGEVLVAKSVHHMMLDIVMAREMVRREKLTEELTTSSCGSDSDESVSASGSSG